MDRRVYDWRRLFSGMMPRDDTDGPNDEASGMCIKAGVDWLSSWWEIAADINDSI
jgi:hypothetical protein